MQLLRSEIDNFLDQQQFYRTWFSATLKWNHSVWKSFRKVAFCKIVSSFLALKFQCLKSWWDLIFGMKNHMRQFWQFSNTVMIGEAEGWFFPCILWTKQWWWSHPFCNDLPGSQEGGQTWPLHLHFQEKIAEGSSNVTKMPKFYTCFVNYTRKTSNDLDYC